jgi:KaiC/GvpD/RAD55 family RecA-like ATPase
LPVNGKAPPIAGWQDILATPTIIDKWVDQYPEAMSTGLLTMTTPAIDIDIMHPEAAAAVEELARGRFEEHGYFLVRIGRPPKRAMLFRTDEPFKKIVRSFGYSNCDSKHPPKIEILGDGQQIVAAGIHPDTRKPYTWHGGEPGEIKREDLPYIREGDARAFLDDAAALLAREFGFVVLSVQNGNANNGNIDFAETEVIDSSWSGLVANILAGRDLHDSIRNLAASVIASGVNDTAAERLLHALMQSSTAPHDERWQDRYDDIIRAIRSARRKFGGDGSENSEWIDAAVLRKALISRCAADIVPEKVEWLWSGRLARGKHTCIAGEPGTGKSQLSVAIVAAITSGGEWPCGEGRCPVVGNVIILSAEDGAADTIVPRLMAAGADLSRVEIVAAVGCADGKDRSAFNLQTDIQLLEQKIVEVGNVALVVVDPVSSYLGKTDSHKNSEVRAVLEPLSDMADRTRVAVLTVTHFSKTGASNTTKALHRFIGSIAFTGAPRTAFAVIEDADSEGGHYLFLHAKNNLAAPPQGLAFRLEQTIIDPGIVASRVCWDTAPVSITANQALAAEATGEDQRSAIEAAEEFLREALAGGPVPQKELKADAEGAGLSWATVRRAKDRLGVTVRRETEGGFASGVGRWLWSLRCSTPPQGAQDLDVSILSADEHLKEGDDDLGIPSCLRRTS